MLLKIVIFFSYYTEYLFTRESTLRTIELTEILCGLLMLSRRSSDNIINSVTDCNCVDARESNEN